VNEIDIADFAQSLMEQERSSGKPVQFGAPEPSDSPDISDVKISSSFAAKVLSEGNWGKANIKVELPPTVEEPEPEPQPEPEVPIMLNEDSLYQKHLLNEYKKKVSDLEELVQEMTSVGMIGVGAGAVAAPGLSVSRKRKKKKKRYARTS